MFVWRKQHVAIYFIEMIAKSRNRVGVQVPVHDRPLVLRNYLVCILLMTSSTIFAAEPKSQTDPLQQFKQRADKFHSLISLPQFETTTNDVASTVKQTIANGNAALDIIGALKSTQVTFKNTV